MFYARLDIHRCVVSSAGLCICVSSYSVNRLLNLLALQVDVEGLCGSASDGSCWTKDTLEAQHTRGRAQKNNKKAKNSQRLLLRFRLNRKLCIFLCTKCTDAMHSSFLFAVFFLASFKLTRYTQAQPRIFAQNKKNLSASCFIVCVHHWMDCCYITHENVGWEVKRSSGWKRFEQVKSWLRVSLEPMCVQIT